MLTDRHTHTHTDRHTDRQADCNTLLPYRGRVKIVTQLAEFIGPLTADERQWRLCLGIGMPIAARQRTA